MFKEIKKIKTGFFNRNASLFKIASLALFNQLEKALSGKSDNLEKIQKIASEFSELKGSIMKAGQLFSVYGESFLPPKTVALLKTLQAQSHFVSYESIAEQLELHSPQILEDFDIEEQPLGSASIGQVHLAKYKKNGKEYAIKVQYPDIEKSINIDLLILKIFFNSLKIIPKQIKLGPILDELKRMLLQELDYKKEAKFATEYRKNLEGDSRFYVPKVFKKYSTARVLVTEYFPGIDLHDAPEQFSQEERNQLCQDFFSLLMKEVFEWGMIQSDPNFGNFALARDENQKPFWVLYDFGATHIIDDELQASFRGMIQSVLDRDRKEFYKFCQSLDILKPSDNQKYLDACWDYCCHFLTPVETQVYDFEDSNLPQELAAKARTMMIHFPSKKTPPFKTIFVDRKVAGTFFIMKKMKAKADVKTVLSDTL